MADAAKLGMRRVALELGNQVRCAQIQPTDNAQNQGMPVCQREQPISFLESLPGLNGNRAPDARQVQ